MAAWLYESILLFAVVFSASFVFSTLTNTRHGLQNRLGQQLFLFAALALYFVWFWCKGGQTLAMQTWRIRVVNLAGHPLRPKQAFIRYCLAWVWVLPPLLCTLLFSIPVVWLFWLLPVWVTIWALLSKMHPEQQFWHDALAQTKIVSVQARRPN